jgi:fructose-specific phosphotransferase system IIA component
VTLIDYMDPRLVELDLAGGGTREVLRQLVDRLGRAGVVANTTEAYERLLEREQVMSTGIGDGIAIPHARTAEVKSTVVVLGRSMDGVPFDAIDGKPVDVVFLILGSPDSSAEHVKVLARIARLVKQQGFHDAALKAATVEQLLEAVQTYQ